VKARDAGEDSVGRRETGKNVRACSIQSIFGVLDKYYSFIKYFSL
jgi:hypothetical protein